MAHSGVSPKVIMELAGHKQLTTTQRYIDVTDEQKRNAVEVL
jgi:integrase/recombinase XerD